MPVASPIERLVAEVLAELDRLGYAPTTQSLFRQFYRRLLRHTEAQGIPDYSVDVGRQFFEATYQCRCADLSPPIPARLVRPLQYLSALADYQLHGTLVRRHSRKLPTNALPEPLDTALAAFGAECARSGYSTRSARTRQDRVRTFLTYVAAQGVAVDEITPDVLSRYTATLANYHPKTASVMLSHLRTFLRYLHHTGRHRQDLSGAVLRLRAHRYERVPGTWPQDALPRLLAAVDRDSPTGKRDYAIVLIAARLGMRVGDITALTLSALDWHTKTITCAQHKTGRAVILPLLDDVGWAIIDYLKHGRPATRSPVLFLRHRAPFEPFAASTNLHNLLTTYVRRAGIAVPAGPHGMHALRHLLASTLLERAIPLPVIADILGHATTQSTHAYLHIDWVGLQRCALDPEEVFDHVAL